MKSYTVKIPIAGHATITVDAKDEDEAITKAMEKVTIDDVDDWEPLEQFQSGNVCYCPKPWEAEAECNEQDDEQ